MNAPPLQGQNNGGRGTGRVPPPAPTMNGPRAALP